MFAIKGDDFEKIEGFPNFWGWGYEDTLINERAVANDVKVDRSIFFDILDKRILRPFDGFERLMSKSESSRSMSIPVILPHLPLLHPFCSYSIATGGA